MNDRESVFRFYSFGIVLEDKVRNSDFIKVLGVEELSIGDGVVRDFKTEGKGRVSYKESNGSKLLKDQTFKYEVTLPDHKNVDRTNTVQGDMYVNAKWIPLGQSNRITAPDMIKGETVMLFRVSDTDQYYWTPLMREPSIRRQETVLYCFGNIPSGVVAWDKESSYWMEVSTHDKYMHVHTAKNDGEPFGYDIKLDTAKGILSITDNAGNLITLDSAASKLTMTTNTDVEINTQNVVVNASGQTTVNTPSTTVNSPQISLNGDVTIAGSLSTSGGSVTMSGGDITMTGGSITANGEDLNVDLR